MKLTAGQQRLLAGEAGEMTARLMRLLVRLGEIYGAADLVPIASAQISGVSYATIGDPGLEFLEDLAGQGVRVRVPATLNPAGMDLADWRAMGVPEDFAARQHRIIAAFTAMGVTPTATCTPDLAGNRPRPGEHLAWAESSAVCFANSVLGARTNREGGPSALAAAVCGCTPRHGLHLDEGRRPTVRVEVAASLGRTDSRGEADSRSEADSRDGGDDRGVAAARGGAASRGGASPLAGVAAFGALGNHVGRLVGDGVPLFVGISRARPEELRALGASLAASGAVALFHAVGLTAETDRYPASGLETIRVTENDLEATRARLGVGGVPDLVVLGCPHASLAEVAAVAERLRGRRLGRPLWVCTSRQVKEEAAAQGLVAAIEEAGGRVVADTCVVVAPLEHLGFTTIAVDSGKAAHYLPGLSGRQVVFGDREALLEEALS